MIILELTDEEAKTLTTALSFAFGETSDPKIQKLEDKLRAADMAPVDIEQLRAALTEIATEPCIDSEGNARIARKALGLPDPS